MDARVRGEGGRGHRGCGAPDRINAEEAEKRAKAVSDLEQQSEWPATDAYVAHTLTQYVEVLREAGLNERDVIMKDYTARLALKEAKKTENSDIRREGYEVRPRLDKRLEHSVAKVRGKLLSTHDGKLDVERKAASKDLTEKIRERRVAKGEIGPLAKIQEVELPPPPPGRPPPFAPSSCSQA